MKKDWGIIEFIDTVWPFAIIRTKSSKNVKKRVIPIVLFLLHTLPM